ncbi:MAG: hypothetical protein NT045_05205, partial [Candidatus Aureabacteria bacterium]|nr:hypothetical protein [Candidatus Auribacterota bacterium]
MTQLRALFLIPFALAAAVILSPPAHARETSSLTAAPPSRTESKFVPGPPRTPPAEGSRLQATDNPAAPGREDPAARLSLNKKKLIQTGVILLLGYLTSALLIGVVNRRVRDLKSRHIIRKGITYLLSVVVMLLVLMLWAR